MKALGVIKKESSNGHKFTTKKFKLFFATNRSSWNGNYGNDSDNKQIPTQWFHSW